LKLSYHKSSEDIKQKQSLLESNQVNLHNLMMSESKLDLMKRMKMNHSESKTESDKIEKSFK